MDSFIWKGSDSYEEYGIIINERPTLPIAEKQVDEFEIIGRNGKLVVDYGAYRDITFSLNCTKIDFSDIDVVKQWLTGMDNLIFSWMDDRYYKARMVNRIDIVQAIKTFGEFPLIFEAEPFAYLNNNNLITLTSQPATIVNPGTIYSNPILKIYGSGTINFAVNGNLITLNNIVDYVTLDSVLMDSYKDTQLMNNNMTGDFPVFNVGNNSITWGGNVTKVEITAPNWRYL